jgi:hypothetical protein
VKKYLTAMRGQNLNRSFGNSAKAGGLDLFVSGKRPVADFVYTVMNDRFPQNLEFLEYPSKKLTFQ